MSLYGEKSSAFVPFLQMLQNNSRRLFNRLVRDVDGQTAQLLHQLFGIIQLKGNPLHIGVLGSGC
ncbi:hypothetical protein D3C80_1972480 [compost metagenome]